MRDRDLLARHLPMVYRIAWTLVGNEADAKDLAHDTMVSALTSWGRFRSESKVTTWLTGILVNRYRKWCRSRATRARLEPRVAMTRSAKKTDPLVDAQHSEELTRLQRAMERLEENDRVLVGLSLYQELDSKETGRILGIPAGTVRARLHEVRAKLRGIVMENRSNER